MWGEGPHVHNFREPTAEGDLMWSFCPCGAVWESPLQFAMSPTIRLPIILDAPMASVGES
jgi:hypothetical protein